MAQDPYQELGVARSASEEDIRKAFRALAKRYHPDKNPGDKSAEERFKRVSAAFDLLGDVDKKRRFDAGEIDADGREIMRAHASGPFRQHGEFGGSEFEGVDLDELLGGMFGGRSGRGGGGRGRGYASRGADVRGQVEIDLEETITGSRKRLEFTDGRAIDVTIPKGASDGQTLRLRGQGAAGPAGPGDAYIELSIRPHPVFRREGDALVMELPISVPDAVLGGKVQAPTPEGPVTLSVPPGSNSGSILRLKRRGLAASGGRRGDLLARLVVTLPETTDGELERFAETWRSERPYSPGRRS